MSLVNRCVFIGALMIASMWVIAPLWAVPGDGATETAVDAAAAASAQKVMASMKLPEGMKVDLFAADPMVVNPVALTIDEKGRLYIAQTERVFNGVEDNRKASFWVDDDLAAQTIDDRMAYYNKWESKRPASFFTSGKDSVRILIDDDADGRADRSKLFAGPFHEPLDGLGSGVLALNGHIYYTNIPSLRLLRDTNGDDVADAVTNLSTGYGVRTALLGHDLHGLILGPDGRIYFTIGDRGYHITTPDGRTLRDPMDVGRGATFRCLPDGSELEVFHTGQRNPQELAFDNYGHLFTGDNNSDAGDRARIVYVVEGGDSGWSMTYQTMGGEYSRGPFHAEKVWHLRNDQQSGAFLPPLAHLSAGPSGFVHNPGRSLPEKFNDAFLLCDFRGSAGNSGVISFKLQPDGAAFKVTQDERFIWNVLLTDLDFGYDGKLYGTDWISGWSGTGKGRVWTYWDPQTINHPSVTSTKNLIATGPDTLTSQELATLLRHEDQRIRLRAHLVLASRSEVDLLTAALKQTDHGIARLHGIWGLGVAARSKPTPAAIDPLIAAVSDADAHVRANAVRVLGDLRWKPAAGVVRGRLTDENLNVAMLAGIALGRMADEASIDALITAIRNNSDRDVFLRHGLVMGLAGCATDTVLMAHASDASPAVRRAVVLALRKHISPEMARFLDDSDLHVVAEAARGIYDLNIAAAMPALADRLNRPLPRGDVGVQNAVFRRAIAANEQLGTPAAAQTLAAFVAEAAVNATMRRVALASVEHFAQARLREPVHNYHRPHDARSPQIIVDTLAPRMPVLMSSIKDEKVLSLLMHVAASLQIKPDAAELLKWIADEKRSNDLRLQSLDSLVQMKWDRLPEAIDAAIASRSQALRTAARRQLVTSDPARALTELVRATQQGETAEKQAAWPMLATLGNEAADAAIGSAMDDLIAGKLAPEQQLDVLQAARSRPTLAAKVQAYDASLSAGDPLSAYRFALLGGDAKKGREVFESHALAQCMRCHKINDEGGDAGPDLSKLAAHSTPESRLESLINPGAVITPGYGTVVITTHSGQTFAGTLKAEDPQRVTLLTTDGMETSIRLTEIATRSPAVSAMPPMGMLLPPNDLRDLLAYLSTLK